MSVTALKLLAFAGALALLAVFLGANAHLVTVAVGSQPPCAEISADRVPARHSC